MDSVSDGSATGACKHDTAIAKSSALGSDGGSLYADDAPSYGCCALGVFLMYDVPYFFWNRSIRPAVSTNFCLPV